MTKFICVSCGYKGVSTASSSRGSTAVEIALWLCLVLPGFLYSLWRSATPQRTCPNCPGISLIPVSTLGDCSTF